MKPIPFARFAGLFGVMAVGAITFGSGYRESAMAWGFGLFSAWFAFLLFASRGQAVMPASGEKFVRDPSLTNQPPVEVNLPAVSPPAKPRNWTRISRDDFWDAGKLADIKECLAKIAELAKTDEAAAHEMQDGICQAFIEAIAHGTCEDAVRCAREVIKVKDLPFRRWFY